MTDTTIEPPDQPTGPAVSLNYDEPATRELRSKDGAGPEGAAEARRLGAVKTARATKHETPAALAPLVNSPDEYETVLPGTQWRDPEGKVRTKPYAPVDPDEYRMVPEGAQWIDPSGKLRTKPVYQDLNYTAQTLYSMGVNDKERRNALERSYPGKVKEEAGTGDLYVDDDGKLIKPRGFIKSPGAALTAGAAPTVGAIAGELIGGAIGSAVPGPGTLAGAVGGAGVGSGVGQSFNDIFLASFGTYDRSVGEQLLETGLATGLGSAGSLLGRMFGASGLLTSKLAQTNPAKVVNMILETDPEGIAISRGLRAKGVTDQPVSPVFPGAPHLINVVEVYDRAMHPGKPPLQEAAAKYYDKAGKEMLTGMGVPEAEIGSLAKPTAATPVAREGDALLAKARERVTKANENLQRAYDAATQPIEAKIVGTKARHVSENAGLEADIAAGKAAREAEVTELQTRTQRVAAERTARKASLEQVEKESREAATGFVEAVYKDIQNDIDEAVKASGAGRNSGELWDQVASKFKAARSAFGHEANEHYTRWTSQYGGITPGTASLAPTAEAFLAQLPPEFRSQYPALVRDLTKLAGVTDDAGKVIKPPTDMTLGELHGLRTVFRQGINWNDLRSDWLNGVKKKFEHEIDDIINSSKGSPEHKDAAKALDKIDKWYSENGAIFSDRRVQAVVNGLRGGEPADPKVLYDIIVKEGRTDLTKKVENMVGPNLWRGIQAADADALMQATKTEVPGQIDANRFINGVLQRHRDGMLGSIHGERTADKWLKQVQNLRMLEGDLPLDIRPGDTITDVLAKAQTAVTELREMASSDPLKLLSREAKAMQGRHAREAGVAAKGAKEARATQSRELGAAEKELRGAQGQQAQEAAGVQKSMREEQLGFLYNPSMGANEAVEKILAKEDLIRAAALSFGPDSPEFNMLRQAFAKKVLSAGMNPMESLAGLTEETQRLMFPGVKFDQMKLLAREMQHLMGTRGLQETAKSMAAQSKVENPKLPFIGRTLTQIPGIGFIPRGILSAYFTMVRRYATHPVVLDYLEKNLVSKDPAVRKEATDALKSEIAKASRVGGAVGTAWSESQYQMGTDHSVIQAPGP